MLLSGRDGGKVVSVLAFNPTIRVWIPMTSANFTVKFVFEKNGNKQKRGRGWPIKNYATL